MFNLAYAMGASGGSDPAAGGGFASLVPLILMFAIFYFLLIRPQQKKAKEHRDMLSALKKGDRVITSGGIHGQIMSLDDQNLILEIADKVRVKVGRGYISALLSQSPEGQAAKDTKDNKEKDKAKPKDSKE